MVVGEEEKNGPVVVLADGVDIHADFFDLLGDGHRGLDAFVLGGGAARGGVRGDVADAEYTDLHDVPFRILVLLAWFQCSPN